MSTVAEPEEVEICIFGKIYLINELLKYKSCPTPRFVFISSSTLTDEYACIIPRAKYQTFVF